MPDSTTVVIEGPSSTTVAMTDDQVTDVTVSDTATTVQVGPISGPPGPPGPPGLPGGGMFTLVVSSPATSVIVDHNLNRYPEPVILTVPGDQVEADIFHNSLNQLVITFGTAFTGTVTCS